MGKGMQAIDPAIATRHIRASASMPLYLTPAASLCFLVYASITPPERSKGAAACLRSCIAAQSGEARKQHRHICGFIAGEAGLRLGAVELKSHKACRSLRPSDVRTSQCGTYELEPTLLAKSAKRGPEKLSQTIN